MNEQTPLEKAQDAFHTPLKSPVAFGRFLMIALCLSLALGMLNLLLPKPSEATPSVEASLPADESAKLAKSKKLASKLFSKVGKQSLALLKLEGAISSSSEGGMLFASESQAEGVRQALDAIAEDDDIKGVLLIINSPGGTVGMSQELNEAVKRVRKVKPVVASLQDIAASGGYYTAVACDKIITNPGTLTASIGVIMHAMNLSGFTKGKLGIEDNTIKSGKYKDILNEFRPMREDERVLLDELIQDTYQDFLAAVLEGRLKNAKDKAEKAAWETQIRAVADGRVVTGNQALKYHLADGLGDWRAAQSELEALVQHRFPDADGAEFVLEPYSTEGTLLQQLGFDVQAPNGGNGVLQGLQQWLSPASQALPLSGGVLPTHAFAAKHPNQPLWLYE